MAEWMTITILASGLSQRVRKSSITAYGTSNGVAYVIRAGSMLSVQESEAELQVALEKDE